MHWTKYLTDPIIFDIDILIQLIICSKLSDEGSQACYTVTKMIYKIKHLSIVVTYILHELE